MSNETVIKISNLYKIYKLYDKPIDRLKETFNPFKKQYHRDFYALKDISFNAEKGEIVGIIGKNGAGKSTLLQIITGVLTPTKGSISVMGKVSALLELGAGFNPELTGLENVYFKSSLMGYSVKEIKEKLDDILTFANIGKFIHQPVKTYSSGMFVRLAFSVAINVEPDILIIDEALSVGDFRFRQKCIRRMKDIMEQNKTILFVSHDTGSVTEFCTKAIWLMDGSVYSFGNPKDICKEYVSYMSHGLLTKENTNEKGCESLSVKKELSSTAGVLWHKVQKCDSFGEGGAKIKRVAFWSATSGHELINFEGGELVVFAIEIEALIDINKPIVGFHLTDPKGNGILGLNSYTYGFKIKPFRKGEVKFVQFKFNFPYLKAAKYSFSPAIAEGSNLDNIQHHWVYDAYMIQIVSANESARLGHYLVLKDDVDIKVQ